MFGLRAELGDSDDPRALVPGDPGAVLGTARTMERFGTALSAVGDGLRKIDDGGWTGAAADAFHRAFDTEPTRWTTCGDAFTMASAALSGYADTLEWAQGQAREAVAVWNQGEAATAAAHDQRDDRIRAATRAGDLAEAANLTFSAFTDPGDGKRAEARAILDRARHQLDSAGNDADRVIGRARDAAPPKPKWWETAGEWIAEFGTGVWEGVVGLGEFAWSISSVRMLTDPLGYAETMASFGTAAQFAWQNPAEFGKAVLDWDTWKENPARAVGRLVPDIALAVATGGAGAVASRGAGTASKLSKVGKALDKVDDVASASKVTRSLDNLPSLRGASMDEVRNLIPENWTEKPLKKGEGARFHNPDRPGEAVMIEKGRPGAADPLHSGPYARISMNGTVERIPLEGNPTLE